MASPRIGKLQLKVPLVVVPSQRVEAAYDYLKQAGIKNAVVSLDYNALSERFRLRQVPAIYVIQGARPLTVILDFEPDPLARALRSYGLIS